MKLSEKIANCDKLHPFYTFEFFPPRTDQGFENLLARITRLSALNPLALSITWGAGGSTKDRSLDLATLTQTEYGLETVLHLTCTNTEEGMVDEILKFAKKNGIQNILALRGDPPRGEEEWIPSDPRFRHAIDLVSYIRTSPEYSSHFCIGVAAYPDGHVESTDDEDVQIARLKAKVDAGADFIATQLFYDVDQFIRWQKKVRETGVAVPIIPGIMPIQTFASFDRLTKLCGTKIPPAVSSVLAGINHDDQLVKDYGVTLAVEMIRRLTQEGDVRGLYFCTLNLEKSVQRILETLQWTGVHPTVQNKLITESPGVTTLPLPDGDGSELMVSPITAATSAMSGLSTMTMTDEAGRGELNKAATWDDFPNGRFGDSKSPAFSFGNQDLWGGSGISRTEALALWGNPKTLVDLTRIFLDQIHSKIPATPFSPTPLSPETLMIFPQIEKMTERGWWTVGSQPAIDGANSADEVVGWGPRAGYVFQKPFVEFFCEEEDVRLFERRIEKQGQGWVHWYACNNENKFISNVPEDGRNAVTWGVFPGQEIAQSTIIEKASFCSWKEEAFSIWSEWASFYRPGSEERTLLERVRDERWLVSIVHHDYKDPQALWRFLFDE